MTGSFEVAPDDLIAHASHLEGLVDRLNSAHSATASAMSDDAYGLLCAFLPPIVNPTGERAADTIKSAAEGMQATADNVRTAAKSYLDGDEANAEPFKAHYRGPRCRRNAMTGPNGLGDLIRDPDEAQRRMDQWAEGLADKAQRYQAAQERTEQLRLTASTSDGAVKVTVGADGGVTDLEFGNKARTYPLDELSRQILGTMRQAQSGIANRVAEVMDESLGDEDRETRSLMLDTLRGKFPEIEDEQAPPAAPPAPAPPPDAPPPPPVPRDKRHEAPDDEDNSPW